jgi:predicted dehydrogenase
MNRGPVEGYKDYRRLLERKDIDAVVVCTPPQWHALMSIERARPARTCFAKSR